MAGKKKETIDETQAAADRAELDLAAAEEVVAEEVMEEQALQPVNQQEREALIADAFKLTGRIEGVSFISKVATVATFMLLKKVKENKVYKDMPGIGTWENYCQSIGISRRQADENLQNLQALGEEFLATVATFGLGYRELRQLRSQAAEGTLSIQDDRIIIDASGDQTEIPLTDKDELKEALEGLLKKKDEQIEREKQLNKTSQKVISAKQKTIDDMASELAKHEASAEALGISADEQKFIRNIQNIKIIAKGQLIKLERHNLPQDMTPTMEAEYISVVKDLEEIFNDVMQGTAYSDSFTAADNAMPELPCDTCQKGDTCERRDFYSDGFQTYKCDNKVPKD
ncbi:MAG: hypothetical protein AB7E76_02700 [Deferribacterales bacterium]